MYTEYQYQQLKCKCCPFAKSCSVRKFKRIENRAPLCKWENNNENTLHSRMFAAAIAALSKKLLAAHQAKYKALLDSTEDKLERLKKALQNWKQSDAHTHLPEGLSNEEKNPCHLCPKAKQCKIFDARIPVKEICCRDPFPQILKQFEALVINWQPMKEKPLPYNPN